MSSPTRMKIVRDFIFSGLKPNPSSLEDFNCSIGFIGFIGFIGYGISAFLTN